MLQSKPRISLADMAKVATSVLAAMALGHIVPAAATAAALAAPIVLDSGDDTVVSESKNMLHDSSECAANAHNGHFRHDGARNKGSAFFTFKFDPPADGCYAIEEYHPSGLSTPLFKGCLRHFPQNARLDVDYCRGKSATLFIDQTANAAQWNEIAHFMFYKDNEGRLTIRSSEAEECEVDTCHLAVDAFRLTWKGESCPSNAESSSAGEEHFDAEKEGVLSLRLKLADGQSIGTVQPVLDIHKAGIARMMARPLGFKHVSILSLAALGRRLTEAQETVQFRFGVKDQISELNEDSLTRVMQEYLGGMLPGLTVLDAKVVFFVRLIAEEENDWVIYAVIISAALVFLCLASYAVFRVCIVWCPRQRKPAECKSADADSAEDVETAFEDVEKAFEDAEKACKDEFGDSASTGTPDSDRQVSEESSSTQGVESPLATPAVFLQL